MKSLLLLWKQVADECATWCCTSADLDYKTVQARSKKEGMSFLTISLPAFGKSFEQALDMGGIWPQHFEGFNRSGRLPAFLQGFVARVFDRETARLLDEPDMDAIIAIRQLTLMFGKILLPCSDARTEDAMAQFVERDNEVGYYARFLSDDSLKEFSDMAQMLFAPLFADVDRKIYESGVMPKHGPGATADRLMGNEKFRLREWTQRLERLFPFGEYLFPSHSYYDKYDEIDLVEPGMERPVKVVAVPKTAKTPRIIAIEPTCMQYVQQGILELINDGLRAPKEPQSSRRINLLRHFICSDSQVPNQDLAYEGSLKGNLATLDLSEASDSVSARLVFDGLLRNHPHLHAAVMASRSQRAIVPGQGEIPLNKFASMGSALCFPFEAMVFLTCVMMGIQDGLIYRHGLNRRLTRRDLRSLMGQVRVYGDDIIVPVEYVHSVISTLELFGFSVNGSKSFWTGRFRESCGKEYYDGTDVSIVRVRREIPTSLTDVSEVISLVSTRNQFYKAGFWQTARYLDVLLSRVIKHYPVVAETSSVLGRYSFLGYETQRMDEWLHAPLVKGYQVTTSLPHNPVDEEGALLKYFLKRGTLPFEEGHLERSGRPRAVNIKPRWCSPF